MRSRKNKRRQRKKAVSAGEEERLSNIPPNNVFKTLANYRIFVSVVGLGVLTTKIRARASVSL